MSGYPTQGITNPGPHDILCGRGGGTNAHPGNIKFRKLVAAHKLRYLAASKSDKPGVAREVVKEWRNLNPPGRFLAKVEESMSNPDQPAVWYDVGDKKAREKASQCLRERNGAANEAVQALVKTVTANGEACPEDYATLMNKAAMVKARNDVALQQQKEMLNQMSQMAEFSSNFGGNGMGGNDEPQPYGLSEKVLSEYSNRGGNDNNGGYNDYSGRGNSSSGGGFNNADNFQQQRQQYDNFQQQNSNQNRFNQMNMNQFQSEDEFIEAEIKRMLQQKQAQLAMAQQHLNANGGMSGMGGNMGSGMGNMGGGRGAGFNDAQPYMGEDSIMKEYMQLMQKQHQMNMNSGMSSGMGNMSGFGGMGGMNSMRNQMNMPQSMGESDEWLWNMANSRANMMSQMGYNNNNNNNFRGQSNMNSMMGGNSGSMQDGGKFSPNDDAARNYLDRLRGMRKNDNNSGGGNNNNNNMMGGGGMMNEQVSSAMVGGQSGQGGGSGGQGFSIEEYQASLQEFLSNDDVGNNTSNRDSNNANNNYCGEAQVYQVPTSLGDKNTAGRSGRDSMQSIGTFARNTFQSVDSNCRRKSFESVDDMDVRPTFRSVDTMDMMSITNSVNDIIDDDVLRNPEVREKYEKKAADGEGYHKFEVATLEVKTMDHGQGGSRPKKIDPRLVAMAGAKHTVQTKQDDGPGRPDRRSSMASVDSRMSFGNM